jgi:hypothetical protein
MRTHTVALATALLFWACILVKAQSLKQLTPPLFSKTDTVAANDSTHTQKVLFKNAAARNASTILGNPAGQKLAGNSKRETDSLQQIILLRKKF